MAAKNSMRMGMKESPMRKKPKKGTKLYFGSDNSLNFFAIKDRKLFKVKIIL